MTPHGTTDGTNDGATESATEITTESGSTKGGALDDADAPRRGRTKRRALPRRRSVDTNPTAGVGSPTAGNPTGTSTADAAVATMLAISADTPTPEAALPDGSDVAPALPVGALPRGLSPHSFARANGNANGNVSGKADDGAGGGEDDEPPVPAPVRHPLALLPTLTDHGDGVTGEIPGGVNRRLASVFSWLLLPVYVTVGPYVRSRTVRMAPAPGPHRASLPGRGKPLRLLVVGDSSVAAVGVSHTSEGLAHRIAENLARKTGRPVTYAMHGNNSAVAGQLRDYVVPHLPAEPFTHIVVSVGANDAKNWHSGRRWRRDFGTLLYALRTRYPDATIVWSRLFDFAKLPAVPASLGLVLNLRRAIICRLADELCIERGAHAAPLMDITHDEGLSRDGFHASALGYRMWGRHLAEFIAAMEPGRDDPRPALVPAASVAPPAPLDEAVAGDADPMEAAPAG